MPMSWTPENDRILLLKLIETHGIKVDAAKIENAWPKGGDKPTARAITERFVKLRKLAGLNVSIGTGSGRSRTSKFIGASAPTTPSSGKKRKTKKIDDESDGEGHMTASDEAESPTKKSATNGGKSKAAAAPRSGRAGSGGLSNSFDDADDEDGMDGPLGVTVKREPTEDPFNMNTSTSSLFQKDLAEARRLRNQAAQNVSNGNPSCFMPADVNGRAQYGASIPSPSFDFGHMDGATDFMSYGAPSFSGDGMAALSAINSMNAQMHGGNYAGGMGMHGGNGMGVGTAMNTNGTGFAHPAASTGLTPHTSRLGLSNTNPKAIPFCAPPKRNIPTNSTNVNNPRTGPGSGTTQSPSVATSEASTVIQPRARSQRQVSQQAAEKLHAFIQAEKDEDKANGEASSVEDSAESEFQDEGDEEFMV